MKYPSMAERLIANSILAEDSSHAGTACWLWTGKVRVNRSGMKYGAITKRISRGRRKGQVVNVAAHRAAVEHLGFKRITPRMVVMHLCNNSLCINPLHLAGGSQRANVRQCVADGRHVSPFRRTA